MSYEIAADGTFGVVRQPGPDHEIEERQREANRLHKLLEDTGNGEIYRDPGAAYFERRQSPERRVKALVAKLEGLGQRVTLEPTVT